MRQLSAERRGAPMPVRSLVVVMKLIDTLIDAGTE
jgi:hypothetical protein